MNYIKEILAFENKQKVDALKPMSQLMWYKLMAVANSSGWKDWFGLNNARLKVEMGIGSDTTLGTARDELIEKGYIQYGSMQTTRKSGKYKLIELSGNLYTAENKETTPDTTAATTPPTTPETTPKYGDVVKEKKTKEKKDKEDEKETEELDLKVILDYYLAVAKRDLESRNDINVANYLISCEGMTMTAIKAGVDKSKKSYKPKYAGQQMPFIYCKPAIFKELEIEKGGMKGGRNGKSGSDSRKAKKKTGNVDERTKRLITGK